MVMLTRSFLAMTQGLEKDSNRRRAHVIHPSNPYYVANESELISTMQEMDTTYWSGQQGGVAPIPQYAMAIATAVPFQPTQQQQALPIAQPATIGTAMPVVPVPGGLGDGKRY